jgi:hypothetical protein
MVCMAESRASRGFAGFDEGWKFGMICHGRRLRESFYMAQSWFGTPPGVGRY